MRFAPPHGRKGVFELLDRFRGQIRVRQNGSRDARRQTIKTLLRKWLVITFFVPVNVPCNAFFNSVESLV